MANRKPQLGSRGASSKGTKTGRPKAISKLAPGPAAALTAKSSGARLVLKFFDADGNISVERIAKGFGMSKGQLAEPIGLKPEPVYRAARLEAPKTHTRATE